MVENEMESEEERFGAEKLYFPDFDPSFRRRRSRIYARINPPRHGWEVQPYSPHTRKGKGEKA